MGEIAVGYYTGADRPAPAGPANVGTCYVGATVAKGAVYNERTGVLYGDDWVFETTRSTPTAPLAPTFASKTEDSVTLVTVDGCEYSNDGASWQESPTFEEVAPEHGV